MFAILVGVFGGGLIGWLVMLTIRVSILEDQMATGARVTRKAIENILGVTKTND